MYLASTGYGDIIMVFRDEEILEVLAKINKQSKGHGPRSKIMEAIIVLLYAKPMRSAEIAQHLGYTSRYISSYLSYWKTRGLVEYNNGLWQLTPQGELLAQQIISKYRNKQINEYLLLAQQIINEKMSSAINNNNIQVTQPRSSQSLPFIAGQTSQIIPKLERRKHVNCLKESISYNSLTKEEQEVLNILLEHYISWGSTYMYVDQLIEVLQANEAWLMRILRMLQTKHIVYLYQDPKLGTRVGFSKSLKKVLQKCQLGS